MMNINKTTRLLTFLLFLTICTNCSYAQWHGNFADYEQVNLGTGDVVCVKKSGKWGLMNLNGKRITPFCYDWIGAFQNRYAIVKASNAYGVIDADGQIVLPVTHESVMPFYPDYFWKDREQYHYESVFYIKDHGQLEVINMSRRYGERSDADHVEAPYDFQAISENGRYGYVNYLGEKISCCYENARDTFSQGLAAVVKDHRIGFIDKAGKIKIPFSFEYSEFDFNFYQYGFARFSEGLCAMMKSGKFGYIDMDGQTVIPFEYDNAYPFHNDFAVVYKKMGNVHKAALINRTNNVIIPYIYDYMSIVSVTPSGQSCLTVMKDNKWGLCSLQGDILANCIYDTMDPFRDGLARVTRGGQSGLIDTRGNLIIACNYDFVLNECGQGLFLARKEGKWGCIDRNEKNIIPFRYDNISCQEFRGKLVFVAREGRTTVYLDKSGRIIH